MYTVKELFLVAMVIWIMWISFFSDNMNDIVNDKVDDNKETEKLVEGFETKPEDEQKDLFDNTTYYELKEDNMQNTGINQCLKDCDGNCLEYGVTGNAWCFHS